jgi:uncharacterized membrane protein
MKGGQNIPWIHQWSRHLIGAIALVGGVETAWLTAAEFYGTAADVCPNAGCKEVLQSAYATVFGLPLSLFGFCAYTSMAILALLPLIIKAGTKQSTDFQIENITWFVMFCLSSAMLVFSSYLIGVMVFQIHALCPYCLASAILSVTLFVLTIMGRFRTNVGQLFVAGCVIGMITLLGVTGVVYANTEPTTDSLPNTSNQAIRIPGETPPPITNESGTAEISLATHLTEIGAKKYGAYWCPHCHTQQELFGWQAFALIDYIECDPKGQNARPKLCQAAGIPGYPTWEINGELYPGVQSLETLADLSDYQGDRNFKYPFPYD